jgi:hypothetical protein
MPKPPARAVPKVDVLNVHTRVIACPAERIGVLLDQVGGPADRLWPSPAWWPMQLTGLDGDRLAVGASGGHGPIRYAVEEYEPGRRVRLRFDPVVGLDGYHEASVEPLDADPDGSPRCRVTHVIRARSATPRIRVTWPVLIRPLHDAVLEDLLDRAAWITTGRVARPARWTPRVRLLHALLWPRPLAVAVPQRASLARTAFDRTDLADAYRVTLRPGMPDTPQTWVAAVFGASPGWLRIAMAVRNGLVGLVGIERTSKRMLDSLPGSTDDEALVGADASHLDFRVSVLVDGGSVVASTVARTRNRRGRVYLWVIRWVHPLVVRAMLRRASRQVALQAPPPTPDPAPLAP